MCSATGHVELCAPLCCFVVCFDYTLFISYLYLKTRIVKTAFKCAFESLLNRPLQEKWKTFPPVLSSLLNPFFCLLISSSFTFLLFNSPTDTVSDGNPPFSLHTHSHHCHHCHHCLSPQQAADDC